MAFTGGAAAPYRATPWAEELKTPVPAENSMMWQVTSVEHFHIECIVVFFSLYRRGAVGANDPFRNMLGMLSAILRTVKDVRLVWGSVRKDNLSDKMWLLTTYFRDYYTIEFLKQFFQILNVPGLSSLRNMMTELVDCYPTTSQDGAATMHSYWELNIAVKPRRPTQHPMISCVWPESPRAKRGYIGVDEQASLCVLQRPDAKTAEKATLKYVRQDRAALEHYAAVAPWDEFEELFNPRNARMNTRRDPRFTPARFFDMCDTVLVQYVRKNVCNAEVHNAFYDRCTRCEYIEEMKKLRWVHKGYSVVLPIPGLTGTTDIAWHEFVHHTTWLECKNALRSEPELFMEHARAARDVVLQPSRNFYVLPQRQQSS